jgi:hypothetical protein
LAELGESAAELHTLLVTLVTQLFEAEDQAKKAEKNGAQATAALLLASVQV